MILHMVGQGVFPLTWLMQGHGLDLRSSPHIFTVGTQNKWARPWIKTSSCRQSRSRDVVSNSVVGMRSQIGSHTGLDPLLPTYLCTDTQVCTLDPTFEEKQVRPLIMRLVGTRFNEVDPRSECRIEPTFFNVNTPLNTDHLGCLDYQVSVIIVVQG